MASGGGIENVGLAKQIRKLKLSRRGKKGAITKRIQQIEKLIDENAGRRRVSWLLDALGTVYTELHDVCQKIDDLTDEEEDEFNDIEDVRSAVDDCTGLVREYLDRRKDDPPSSGSGSIVSKWVEAHRPGNFESCSESGNSSLGSKSGSSGSSEDRRKSAQDQSERTEVSGAKLQLTPITPRILPKIPVSEGIIANTPLGVTVRDDTKRLEGDSKINVSSTYNVPVSGIKEISEGNHQHSAEGAERFLDSAEDCSLGTKNVSKASDQPFGGGAKKRVGFENNSLGTDLASLLGTNTTFPLDTNTTFPLGTNTTFSLGTNHTLPLDKPFVSNSIEPFCSGGDFLSETPKSDFLGGGFSEDDKTSFLDDRRQDFLPGTHDDLRFGDGHLVPYTEQREQTTRFEPNRTFAATNATRRWQVG